MNEEAFSKLSDITSGDFRFFFMAPKNSNKLKKYFPNDHTTSELLEDFIKLGDISQFSYEKLKLLAETRCIPIADITKYKFPNINLICNKFRLIRLSLLDTVSGPPISELIEFLGNDEIMKRFSYMLEDLNCGKKEKDSMY